MSSLASRYAQAIFELGKTSEDRARLNDEFAKVAALWESSQELRNSAHDPTLSKDLRQSIWRKLAAGLSLSNLGTNALLLLSDRKRSVHIPAIATQLQQLCEDEQDFVRAEITTATPVSEAYINTLRQALEKVTHKQVRLTCHVDASMMGGVIAQVGDYRIDGSLKHHLTQLEDHLLNA